MWRISDMWRILDFLLYRLCLGFYLSFLSCFVQLPAASLYKAIISTKCAFDLSASV